MTLHPFFAGSAAALALVVATIAGAQTAEPPATAPGATAAPPSPRQACRSSAMSLCHDEVKAGERAAIRACLIKNFDKVTPECQASMKYAQAHGAGAKDAAPPQP